MKIIIDNDSILYLGNNESKTIEIPVGVHEFYAKASVSKSDVIKVEIKDNEIIKFTVGTPESAHTQDNAIMIGLCLAPLLKLLPNFIIISIFFIFIAYMIYLLANNKFWRPILLSRDMQEEQ